MTSANARKMERFRSASLRDITERKLAEEALQQSEERFSKAFHASPAAIAIASIDDGLLYDVNETWLSMLAYSRDEVIGKTVKELGLWADLRRRSVYIEIVKRDGSIREFEGTFFKKGGEALAVVLAGETIELDGEPRLLVAFHDITEHKLIEEALRENEQRYRSVTDSTTDAIIAIDGESNIISWNRGASSIFGYQEKEMLGKKLLRLIPEGLRDAHNAGLKRASESGRGELIGKTVELSGLRKGGEEFPLELSLGSWKAGGKTFFSCIICDITKRKETEGQLRHAQKMDALGNLAGGIAHDLNNMLLPILTLTGMTVKKLPEDSVERERLDKVMQAAEKARDLVKRILAFSRQKADMEMANIDLYASIKEAMGLLRSTLPATIEIKEKLNMNVGEVFADSAQIQTVLLNLATNSVDAMEGKTGKLEVTLKRTRDPNKLNGEVQGQKPEFCAKLSVRDTGCGMDKETLSRVFDPFFTTKGVGEGTGLGLSMVHGIITSHGGALDVVSSPGRGSTFHIYLPLAQKKSQVQG